jgi:hypothetical protein
LEASLGKKLVRPYFNKELGVVVYICHPNSEERMNRRITVQAGLGKNARLYLKNN